MSNGFLIEKFGDRGSIVFMDHSFQEIRDILKQNAIQLEKLILSQKNLEKSQAKTDQQIKEISKSFNGFTRNQGSMIENLFFESLRNDMMLNGVIYDDIFLNLEAQRKELGLNQEFDIILKNGSDIAIIETKSIPALDDLEQLENMVKNYKIFFKEHKDYKIKGFLASLHKFNSHFKKQAHKKGFKLLNLKGKKVEVI